MAVVAGVDFGTLSVRVSVVDSEKGRLSPQVGLTQASSQTSIQHPGDFCNWENYWGGSAKPEPRRQLAGANPRADPPVSPRETRCRPTARHRLAPEAQEAGLSRILERQQGAMS